MSYTRLSFSHLINTLLHDTDQCQSNSCLSPCPVAGIRSCPAGSPCSSPSTVPSADDPGYWLQAGLMCAYLQSSAHHEELWQLQQSLEKKISKEIKPNASHLLKCPKPWNSSKARSTIFTMQPLFSQGVISNQSMTWFSISDFVVAYHALGLNIPATAGDLVPNWTQ